MEGTPGKERKKKKGDNFSYCQERPGHKFAPGKNVSKSTPTSARKRRGGSGPFEKERDNVAKRPREKGWRNRREAGKKGEVSKD